MMMRLTLTISAVMGMSNLLIHSNAFVMAAEPEVPLRWQHVGNTSEIHAHPYLSADKTKRVVRVVLDRLGVNRPATADEFRIGQKYALGDDDNGIPHFRPADTFRLRSERAVLWVLDGDVDTKLEKMTPLGVVYCLGEESCGPIIKHYTADIIWHPGRKQYLLFLGMSCSNKFSVAIFPFDLDRKLDVKTFDFADKQPIQLNGPQTKWPEPLPIISELRTYLPDDICDIMCIRAIPERKLIRNEMDERNLLISGWNTTTSGETCSSVTYRYRLRQRKWTQVTYDEKVEVPVKIKKTGNEKLDKFLETFPEETDPGSSPREKPLEPIPDVENKKEE